MSCMQMLTDHAYQQPALQMMNAWGEPGSCPPDDAHPQVCGPSLQPFIVCQQLDALRHAIRCLQRISTHHASGNPPKPCADSHHVRPSGGAVDGRRGGASTNKHVLQPRSAILPGGGCTRPDRSTPCRPGSSWRPAAAPQAGTPLPPALRRHLASRHWAGPPRSVQSRPSGSWRAHPVLSSPGRPDPGIVCEPGKWQDIQNISCVRFSPRHLHCFAARRSQYRRPTGQGRVWRCSAAACRPSSHSPALVHATGLT